MLKTATILVTITVVMHLCSSEDTKEEMVNGMRLVSQSTAYFTSDFYEELRSKNESFVYSPYSLSLLLAMLNTGCRGDTASEIKEALRLTGLNDTVILQGYSELIRSLQFEGSTTFLTANKIYVDDLFKLKSTFLESLQTNFKGDAESVKFSQRNAAAKTINEWVSHKTKGKISELILPDSLSFDTKSILVNAVYFSGKWLKSFNAERTEKKPFHTIDDNEIQTDFMKAEDRLPWARLKNLEADAIAIPYTGGRIYLMALLPINASGFKDFEDRLRGYDLSGIPEKMEETPVILEFPKLRLESTFDLVNEGLLEKRGIKTAFGNGDSLPDLSGMTENTQGLYVNSFVQKAFLEITEEGTTAAAAGQTATVVRIRPQRFIANRPFVAYIFDSETKSILFLFRKTK